MQVERILISGEHIPVKVASAESHISGRQIDFYAVREGRGGKWVIEERLAGVIGGRVRYNNEYKTIKGLVRGLRRFALEVWGLQGYTEHSFGAFMEA